MNDSNNLYRNIFFPHNAHARDRAIASGGRFVYYTTTETAYLILKNREIWLRNTSVMNDYMEINHGLNCIVNSYRSSIGQEFEAALDKCFSGISGEIRDLFNSWIPIIKQETYVISVSEHAAADDEFGRLSMWRAYGGNAGVALVFNGGVMSRPSDALGAYSSPVAYLNSDGVAAELTKIKNAILENVEYVRSLGREGLKHAIFEAFRFAAICTKHPAFLEEKEWRVVSTKVLHDNPRLPPHVEIVGGIPQKVLKLKLEDHPDEGLYGLAIPSFIDRILIGPCEYSETIKRALTSLLGAAAWITRRPECASQEFHCATISVNTQQLQRPSDRALVSIQFPVFDLDSNPSPAHAPECHGTRPWASAPARAAGSRAYPPDRPDSRRRPSPALANSPW